MRSLACLVVLPPSLAAEGMQVSLQTDSAVGAIALTPTATQHDASPANTPITNGSGSLDHRCFVVNDRYVPGVDVSCR